MEIYGKNQEFVWNENSIDFQAGSNKKRHQSVGHRLVRLHQKIREIVMKYYVKLIQFLFRSRLDIRTKNSRNKPSLDKIKLLQSLMRMTPKLSHLTKKEVKVEESLQSSSSRVAEVSENQRPFRKGQNFEEGLYFNLDQVS